MSKLILVFIMILGLVPALAAQRSSGSRQTPSRGAQSGTRDQIRDRDRLNDHTRDQDWLRDRDVQRDRQQLRIPATAAQKQQSSVTARAASQARTKAREMLQSAQGNGLNGDQVRQQHLRLQEQVRNMQQEHARMMQGLTGAQRSTVQEHTQAMNRVQERLNVRLQSMNGELQKSSPDPKSLAESARAMENDLNQWQQHQQDMASTLGLQD